MHVCRNLHEGFTWRYRDVPSGPSARALQYRGLRMVQRVVPQVIRVAKVYRASPDRAVGLDLFRRVYNFTTLRFY